MINKLFNLIYKNQEIIKFGIIGFSGIIINYITLFICINLLNIHEKYALLFAIFISMTSNYYFNRIWTFSSKNKIYIEYIKYIVSNLSGGIIQYFISLIFYFYFKKIGIVKIFIVPIIYIGSTIGIIIGFIFNFIISKYFVFNKPRKKN